MPKSLPSADEIAAQLRVFRMQQLRELAERSGVPFRTLLKIRIGETPNPGLETVRKFFHLLPVEGELQTHQAPTNPPAAQAAQASAQ